MPIIHGRDLINIKRRFAVRGNDPGDFTGTDDTTQFQVAASSAERVIVPKGFYKITSTLTVENGTKLIGDGSTDTVLLLPKGITSAAMIVESGSTIEGIKVLEYDFDQFDLGKTSSTGHGIFIGDHAGSVGVTLRDVIVHGFNFPGKIVNSDNNFIANCEFAYSLHWGLELDNSQNNVLHHCWCHHNGWDGVKMQSQEGDTEERSCVATKIIGGTWEDNGARVAIDNATNGNGIDLWDGGMQTHIVGATIRRNYGGGVNIKGEGKRTGQVHISDCDIYGNLINPDEVGGHGIELGSGAVNGSRQTTITNCNIWDNQGAGIFCDGGDPLNVTNCNITGNWRGIYLNSAMFNAHVSGGSIMGNYDFNLQIGSSFTESTATTQIRNITFDNVLISSVFDEFGTRPTNAAKIIDTFTVTITDKIHAVAHTFSEHDCVSFRTTDTLPTGLAIQQRYWVVGTPETDDFQISDRRGGTAVSISTGTGAGTHTVSTVHSEFSIRSYPALNDVRFRGCTILGGWNTAGTRIQGHRNIVEQCRFAYQLRQGLYMTGDNCVVRDNVFTGFDNQSDATKGALYLDGNGTTYVDRNQFMEPSTLPFSVGIYVADTQVATVTVSNTFVNYTSDTFVEGTATMQAIES